MVFLKLTFIILVTICSIIYLINEEKQKDKKFLELVKKIDEHIENQKKILCRMERKIKENKIEKIQKVLKEDK